MWGKKPEGGAQSEKIQKKFRHGKTLVRSGTETVAVEGARKGGEGLLRAELNRRKEYRQRNDVDGIGKGA